MNRDKSKCKKNNEGSIELIVLGLLAALIVVLAIPALSGMGFTVQKSLNYLNSELDNSVSNNI